MPILMRARAIPMVRTLSPMRCFLPAITCSTAERTADRLALALAMRSGIGRARVPSADEAVRAVDTDVVLVAEHRDSKVDRPERLGLDVLHASARIAILLAKPSEVGLPCLGDAAVLDRRIEACEEFVHHLGIDQPLAEQPLRRRIGHGAIEPETQEPLKPEPILDLELRCLVRQPARRLQHQDLEHQNRIERWPAALAASAPPQRRQQRPSENLEVDQGC